MGVTILDQPPTPRSTNTGPIRDEWGYMLPMLAFLGFIWVGSTWKDYYPASYVARTVVAAVLMWAFWRCYTKIVWSHLGLGAAMGVVGLIQWVGMEKLLMWGARHIPLLGYSSLASPEDAFRPYEYFAGYPAWVLYGWLAIRLAGATLVVPVMEELFWRDWLWRTFLAPNDFKLARVGERDFRALAFVSVAFSVVHVQILTSIVWALLVGWLLIRTRSLGACIVMHAVTNLLLGIYVLATQDWYFW
jgi:CAAX prenyl protease-like protein